MRGLKVISNAISVFNSVINKLQKGMELCNNSITEKMDIISTEQADVKDLVKAVDKAEKMINNIKKILEE